MFVTLRLNCCNFFLTVQVEIFLLKLSLLNSEAIKNEDVDGTIRATLLF
jgi:hypothetical protein